MPVQEVTRMYSVACKMRRRSTRLENPQLEMKERQSLHEEPYDLHSSCPYFGEDFPLPVYSGCQRGCLK